ncbi:erythrulose kinase [Microbacterium sorbitolivorans]|uniref:DAK2 domain-containing protein n=1 Tax=Microbacterium sorbitolivorans TaxID=1867410 RepID=A0A367XXB6_9MICO|nr:dihydroxyacetone kinase family protein [Microbacterium sorbitolivorans]RCK58257.1 DAK2 domain-containing protein [Microbacterium sorbitolivorans]GGF38778.1 erythrulose kinase [Microbacterium sorbitolivorans]
MTRLWNDPADFADEMIDGFVAANGRYVRRVTGGVARSTQTPEGQVAFVTGGGSGHYPAFGGLVGPGLAHGAAMGNLFASPSTQQVLSVAKAAENGGGVFLSYGNYAGDVLNFDAAQEQLRAAGIPCQTVAVTDDVSSAGKDEIHKRRGIAGDLTVFRIAGAAAERGLNLDEVTRLARRANDRTRSFGVAFSGCSLPGADEPLFEVKEGHMAIGLGIHGEPGLGDADIPTADGLAEMLVERLLDELPDDVPSAKGARVVPVLNGLGSLKYEEMFVVYRRIAQLLDDAGITAVDPHVGEYCTSFDMAGTSLTLLWLDDELEDLWDTGVDTPAYRRGSIDASRLERIDTAEEQGEDLIGDADDDSRAIAKTIADAFDVWRTTIDENVDELGRLDAIAGDGDHGIGMQRGIHAAQAAARDAADRGAGAATTLARAADAWSDRAGGTSGAIWGAILDTVSQRLGDAGRPTNEQVAEGLDAAKARVATFGAVPGDKTLVDSLNPLVETFSARVSEGASIADAWRAAADAATAAAAATTDMLPQMGRARAHHEKALGIPDPGAHSLALLAQALLERHDDD